VTQDVGAANCREQVTMLLACTLLLVGCSSTSTGQAVKASDSTHPDGAVIALLDAGTYATAAGHPYGPP
jgi:hypothetical protein